MPHPRSTSRRTAALLASALFVLTGCGGASDGEAEPAGTDATGGETTTSDETSEDNAGTTLRMLTFTAWPDGAFDAFTEETGIEVETEFVSSSADFPSVLQTRVAGKADIDVFNVRSGAEFNKYAAAGTFQDVSGEDFLSRVNDAGVDAGTVEGTTYGWAMEQFVIGVFYNPTLFEEAGISGPPQDWEGFLAACEQLKAAGVDPVAWSGADGWTNQYMYHNAIAQWAAANPDFMEALKTGDATWHDNELFVSQVERWEGLAEQDHLMPGGQSLHYADAATAFSVGRAAMWMMGNWGLADVAEAEGFEPGAFALPINDAGEPTTSASLLTDNMFAISSWSEKSDAALQLFDHMTQPEFASTISEAAQRASTVDGVDVQFSPYQADWDAMAETGVPYPHNLGPSVNNNGPALLSEVSAGAISPDEAIDKFQDLQEQDNETGY